MASGRIWTICRGEPRNHASWSVEFGKFGKLWALIIRHPGSFVDRGGLA